MIGPSLRLLIISPIDSSRFKLIVSFVFGWDELVEMMSGRNIDYFNVNPLLRNHKNHLLCSDGMDLNKKV